MPIKDLILKDHNGANFNLLKYQSKNFLIVIFYRGYWCNICRAQLQDFNKNLKKFERPSSTPTSVKTTAGKKASAGKAKIVAISGDEPLYASLLSTHIKAKFPILPDPKMKAFKAFDLKIPKNKKEILPAIFIVSPIGQIIYTNISKNPEERPEIKEILRAIDIR